MNARARKGYLALLLVAVVCILARFCPAQATPAVTRPPDPSRVDLFGGYGYFHPVNSDIYNQPYTTLMGGGIGGFIGYFNRSFGIDAEYAKYPDQPDYCFSSIQAGPVFRINLGRLVPFAQVIGGAAQEGPSYAHSGSSNPCAWGWTASMGLGVDYVVPGFHNHLAIRPIAGDFQLTSVNFGAQSPLGGFSGGVGQIFAVRLSAGLIIRLGGIKSEQTAGAINLATAAPAVPISLATGTPAALPPRPGPQTLSGNYVIGPDDSIRVEVFKEPDLSATVPVRPDGKISLPLVGDVSAAGLTPMQLAADLTDRFKKFVTDPVVGVTVQAVKSNRIFLIGQVAQVGPLSMTPGMTVLQAIAAAGGLTPYANRTGIYILRGDPGKPQKIPFNYNKALKAGDMQRISLQAGDTIVVP